VVYELAHSPTTPAAVKLECAKFATKAADLEPKEKSQNLVLLPMIAGAIQALPQEELERRVAALVARKQQSEPIDVTPTYQ
jgi:hypothetical protein